MFFDSIDDIFWESNERHSSDELIVEVVFEKINDAKSRDEALKLYEARSIEKLSPVIGIVGIPIKIRDEEESDEAEAPAE